MLLISVKNVIIVMRYRSFRFMSVLMFLNVTGLFIVIRALAIIKLIMFVKFIQVLGTFRIINANEVYFWI